MIFKYDYNMQLGSFFQQGITRLTTGGITVHQLTPLAYVHMITMSSFVIGTDNIGVSLGTSYYSGLSGCIAIN